MLPNRGNSGTMGGLVEGQFSSPGSGGGGDEDDEDEDDDACGFLPAM